MAKLFPKPGLDLRDTKVSASRAATGCSDTHSDDSARRAGDGAESGRPVLLDSPVYTQQEERMAAPFEKN